MSIASTRDSMVGAALVVAGLAAAAGCEHRDSAAPVDPSQRPTQGALSSAVDRVSRDIASAIDPRNTGAAPQGLERSHQLPEVRVQGDSVDVHADEDHVAPTAVRTGDGWALTWGDRDHAQAIFARLDADGHAVTAPVVVREARSDEEDVWSPAVAFTGQEFGMVWADPGNGRVRFVRLDERGHQVGHSTIIHDGLEMPLGARVVWTGTEFGVAAAMHSGVYFARVDAHGARIGDGVMLAEGATVASLDNLTAGPNGYQVAWRDVGDHGAVHQARVTRAGQLVEGASAARSTLADRRLALR